MARKEKQEIMLIILTMFLAFLLWAYVMGEQSPEHKRLIQNIPVKIVNEDRIRQYDLALVPEQSVTVDLNVAGPGLTVFNVSPDQIVVEADLNGYPLKKGENKIPYKIVSLPPGIKQVDNGSLMLVSIELDAYIEKSVPVNLSISGDVKSGYGYLKPNITPTEVLVSGPEQYVNAVTSVVGLYQIPEGAQDNLTPNIYVKPQGRDGKTVPYVETEPNYVKVEIQVKPAKTVPIAVKTNGKIPDDKVLRSIKPETEKITIIGDSKVLANIKEIETVPIDLSKLTSSGTREVALNIPAGVTTIGSIKSINVEVNVENKVNKDFDVKLSMLNRSDAFSYEIQVSSITVRLNGAESIINGLDTSKISAVVDLRDLDEGTHSVNVAVSAPEEAKLVSYTPQRIEIVVTRK